MMTSLRSKWAAGKARGERISKWIRNRRATQPPAHFHRNPLGRDQLAVFPRGSLLTYRFRYARRYCQSGSDRLEKQPTGLRRKACLFREQDTSKVRKDDHSSSGFQTRLKPKPLKSLTFAVANSMTPWRLRLNAVRASQMRRRPKSARFASAQ